MLMKKMMLFAAMLVGMTTFAQSWYQPNCNGNYNPYGTEKQEKKKMQQ
jgi:hypothetical protein